MSTLKRLMPVNRHLTIIPHKKKKDTQESVVLLPEDYTEVESQYVAATVVDVASDCNADIKQLKFDRAKSNEVVIDRSMIQEVEIHGKVHYLVLENYVMGIIRDA